MSDYENKVVRGYRMDVTIGSGGFGTVYHAFQEVLQREVAVKVIKDKYVNDPQFVRQFEAEARIIARMEHFNIVTLYDYWRDPGGAYLVMRWLRGGSLRSYLKQTRLDIPQIVRIVNQTAAALSFAHQHNVIHRDIKPENILLDNEGNAFLTDFGIAVDLRNQDNTDIENISFGSPDYVAPEQLKDRIITPRSDIYSLGIMLYELLASERPFVSDDAREIMKMQLYNPVPSLRLKRPDLPPEIDTVIWQSTAKNPAHRYDNVLELAIAFQNIARKMEEVPVDYIINTKVHKRKIANQDHNQSFGDLPTENLETGVLITGQLNEDLSTGVLPDTESGEGELQFNPHIDTIPDALHTDVIADTDDVNATLYTPFDINITPDMDNADEFLHTKPLNLVDDDATEALDPLTEHEADYNEQPLLSRDSFDTPIAPLQSPVDNEFYVNEIAADTNQFGEFARLMTLTIEGEGPPNPYKGLRAFEEADAGSFFGREEVVARLVNDFAENESRFLALIGPSGSGKSSVVRAGMIPAFRRGAVPGSKNWFYSTMIPGDDPLRELSEAILRIAIIAPENWGDSLSAGTQGLHKLLNSILPDDGSELLLFIDQFEEVFTLCDDETKREHFLNSLWYAVNQENSRLRLIVTLRADFYDRPLHYPQFGKMLQHHTEVVLPLSLQELESAILGPAGRVGLLVEPALKNAILNDVHNQPGALPLLQYALTELYERKGDEQQSLTLDHYQKIGGIEGALAQRARDIYLNDLSPEEQNLARKLFLRIIAIDENGTVTRRRLLWKEMMSGIDSQETLQNVIDAFSKHRLLTQDLDQVSRSPTIEVAHEALIKGWDQLGQWIEQNRVALQKRQELRLEVDRWILNARDKSYLAGGNRLFEFESLVKNDLLALREEEMNFIADSINIRETTARNKRRIDFALRVFSIVTFISFFIAIVAFGLANNARGEAVEQAQVARSRELAASSLANEDMNDLSLLLASEAYEIANTYESRNSLLLALQQNPFVIHYFHGQDGGIRSVDIDSTGTIAVSGGLSPAGNTIIRRNLNTGDIIGEPLTGHTTWINDIEISPDDSLIASASSDGTIRLWDFETGAEIGILEGHENDVWALSFSPDGRQLASAGTDGRIILWDVEAQAIDTTLNAISETDNGSGIVFTVDFDNDGTRLVSGGDDNLIRLWDMETGELITEIDAHQNWVRTVQFDPTNNAILSADTNGWLYFLDTETGENLVDPIITGHTGGINDISFSFDGAFMATAGADGRIIIWSLNQRGVIVATIEAHQDTVRAVKFNPQDNRLVSVSDDGNMLQSQLTAIQRPGDLLFNTNQTISEFDYAPDSNRFVLVGEPFNTMNSMIQVLNSETIELLYEISIRDISNSNDNNTLLVTDLATRSSLAAVSIASGEIAVWDLETGDLHWVQNGHTAIPKELEITPDASRIISADETGTVLVWDAATGDLIETSITAPESGVTAMTISPDGNYLAIGGRGDIALWNLNDESLITDSMVEHSNAIIALLFDDDSETLFSSSRDRTIVQWSISGEFIQRFTGYDDWVLSLALNPAGDTLVSGERTGSIHLREIATGRPIGDALRGPNGWLTALHFVDDTTVLGSNRQNGVVLTWTLDVSDWLAFACDISNRPLSESEWMQFFSDEAYNPACRPDENPD